MTEIPYSLCLSNEATTPTDPNDLAYKAFLRNSSTGIIVTSDAFTRNDIILAERETEAEHASAHSVRSKARNKDSGRKFSSSRPNQALLWALIDDSKQNQDDHLEAIAIMDNWQQGPWKGQIWKARGRRNIDRVWTGPVHHDLVWTGTDWKPYKADAVVEKPLVNPVRTRVSMELAERLATAIRSERSCKATAKELNDSYDRYALDPIGEKDNLWVTIAAFSRSIERLTQCRKLIMRNPEMYIGVDDIFEDFNHEVWEKLDTGLYPRRPV